MSHAQKLKKEFYTLALYASLCLLALPAFSYWFVEHAEAFFSGQVQTELLAGMQEDGTLSAQERASAKSNIEAITVARICAGEVAFLAQAQAELCGPLQEFGQFELARKVSAYTLLLGLLTLVLIGVVGLLSYYRPQQQYLTFTLSWWTLRGIGALEVLLQGALLVWLSYWLTAYFLSIYVIKLILLAVIAVGMGIFVALAAIFKRSKLENPVSGELITEAQAPALWARIRQFAGAIKTAPPANVIGGIDDNFFVTEVPVQLHGAGAAGRATHTLTGRTLFVSLPLLGVMNWDESDAVLAHELAHFSGGDTQFNAAMGAKMSAFSTYSESMQHGGFTLLLCYPLWLFRAVFEIGYSRSSRTREFAADALAARATSPSAIARALVKISGYSNFRAHIQQTLFDSRAQHEGALNIAQQLREGLPVFTATPLFAKALDDGATPHPFDSHPPMRQRMQHVGADIAVADYASVALSPPQHSWLTLIPDAASIETRLWQQFEQAFAQDHDQALAFRYEPANDAERAVVLRYFPDVEIAGKKANTSVKINYSGISTPTGSVAWKDVKQLTFNDGNFFAADKLVVMHPEKSKLGTHKSTTLKLPTTAKQREQLKEVMGRYWARDQAMRQSMLESTG
jgi:Zn-dependent protease with chaperone function